MRSNGTQKVQKQATRLRNQHPELFNYLLQRDRQIQRALSRVPDPEDTEISGAFSSTTVLQRTLSGLPPGIGELSGVESTQG